jgi:hypothetical protein
MGTKILSDRAILLSFARIALLTAAVSGCASTGRGPGPELWFGSYVRVTTAPPGPVSYTGTLTRVTEDSVELAGRTREIRIFRGRIAGLAVAGYRSGRGRAIADGAELGAGIGTVAGGIAASDGAPQDRGEDMAKGMAIGGAAGAALGAGIGALSDGDDVEWYVLDPRNLDRLVGRAPAPVPASRRRWEVLPSPARRISRRARPRARARR